MRVLCVLPSQRESSERGREKERESKEVIERRGEERESESERDRESVCVCVCARARACQVNTIIIIITFITKQRTPVNKLHTKMFIGLTVKITFHLLFHNIRNNTVF